MPTNIWHLPSASVYLSHQQMHLLNFKNTKNSSGWRCNEAYSSWEQLEEAFGQLDILRKEFYEPNVLHLLISRKLLKFKWCDVLLLITSSKSQPKYVHDYSYPFTNENSLPSWNSPESYEAVTWMIVLIFFKIKLNLYKFTMSHCAYIVFFPVDTSNMCWI